MEKLYRTNHLIAYIYAARHPEIDPFAAVLPQLPQDESHRGYYEVHDCLSQLVRSAAKKAMTIYGDEWTYKSKDGKLKPRYDIHHAHSVLDEIPGILKSDANYKIRFLASRGYNKNVFEQARKFLIQTQEV